MPAIDLHATTTTIANLALCAAVLWVILFLFLKKNTILWWVADGVGIAWKAEIVIANVIIRTTRSNKTYSWISIKLNARKIMSKKQFIQIIKKWISNAKPWQTKNGLEYWIIWDSYYMLFKLMFHEFAKEKYEFAKSDGKRTFNNFNRNHRHFSLMKFNFNWSFWWEITRI